MLEKSPSDPVAEVRVVDAGISLQLSRLALIGTGSYAAAGGLVVGISLSALAVPLIIEVLLAGLLAAVAVVCFVKFFNE